MKIQEAIERLKQDYRDYSSPYVSDLSKAQQLGIEALKRHKEMSALVPAMPYPLLPGETTE